jgi:hypothetical protein
MLPAELGGFFGNAGASLGRIAVVMARVWLLALSLFFDDLARVMDEGSSAAPRPSIFGLYLQRACVALRIRR